MVGNYLRIVNGQAKMVYLREVMAGKEIASKRGLPGVLKRTTSEHYQEGLDNFENVDVSSSILPTGELASSFRSDFYYSNSFWKRR